MTMNILQISTYDIAGGAEKVALDLHRIYLKTGHSSYLAVGNKLSEDPYVLPIPNNSCRPFMSRVCLACSNLLSPFAHRVKALRLVRAALHWIGQPLRGLDFLLGREDFRFPGTRHLPELPPTKPDILHGHNLHGGYFDLRMLPRLSRKFPTVLTLHDAWLLSGHCAHSFSCQRWKYGCGNCPDLSIYPAIRRDSTAYNFHHKEAIYRQCSLYLTSPSSWLLDQARQSILSGAIASSKVIRNGVDLSIFKQSDMHKSRKQLGLPQEDLILLFTANSIRNNIWKDFKTLRTAVAMAAEDNPSCKIRCIALGETAPSEKAGNAEIDFISYTTDPFKVARYYQAADLYIHASRIDTFPNTIIEALACGTPVVATAVGGIPEIVTSMSPIEGNNSIQPGTPESTTGILTPQGDAQAMAHGIKTLLFQKNVRHQLSENAVKDAQERFDLKHQADTYLEWYREIIEHFNQTRKC